MRIQSLLPALAGLAAAVTAQPARAIADRILWDGFEAPIATPVEQWTWVDFPNSECGDGSATGIGINPTTLSDRVLIYLQGGGACWNEFNCFIFPSAEHFDGYGAADFASDATDTSTLAQSGGFFDRGAATNPFKDYSYVFVPYCTGDIFGGDNVVDFGGGHVAHFVGFRNMTAFLERLAVTFPAPGRVVLAGSSAGGFGAAFNWWQTQNAFPNAHVDMIDDSGAVMPEDVLPQPNTTEQTQRTNWNLAATLPPGCSGCDTAFDPLLGFYAGAFPDNRGALLSYNPDPVLAFFYGISLAKFSTGLAEIESQRFDTSTNLRYFEKNSTDHVLWFSPTLSVNGTSVRDFVAKMVSDDANWASVKP